MKTPLSLFFVFLCATSVASELDTITVKDDWSLLVCKQGDAGLTLQRRHFPADLETKILRLPEIRGYEIWLNGEFKTSCDNVYMRKTTTAGSSL
jgi:hypothetical protein